MFLFTASVVEAQTGADTTVFDLGSHAIPLIHNWRIRTGDSFEWASPEFNDADWIVGSPNRLPGLDRSIHWLRARIRLTGARDPYDVLILRFSKLPLAFEVFWDGERIGENGRVGQITHDGEHLREETPGNAYYSIKMPGEITRPGTHLLVLRFSNVTRNMRPKQFWAIIAYHADWIRRRANDLHLQYFWLGIYLTAMFLSFALFLGGGRHRAFFIFAIYTLLVSIYLAINPIFDVINVRVTFSTVVIAFRYAVFLVAGMLLNLFFITHFDIPRKRLHLPIIIGLPLIIDLLHLGYVGGLEWRATTMMIYAIGLLIWAVKKRRAGSMIALLGMLAFAFPMLYRNLNVIFHFLPRLDDQVFVPISFIFIPAVILSISRQIREQNRLYEAAMVRSHRLETELLKSRIQPHFISNTLHSVKSWFRDDSKRAEKLIQTLAEEFRIINSVSAQTLIPIQEEIRLCETHLEIMGSRRDVKFELSKEHIPEDESVPPLIFHTLIENGLTHAYAPDENGRFEIQYDIDAERTVYTVKNDGSRLQEFAQQDPPDIEEGLGLAYVKARLEESYPARWTIDYGLKAGQWEVVIQIRK